MTVFSNEMFDATEQTCFFGKQVNIARYDKQRYNIFEKLTDKQLGFFGVQKKSIYQETAKTLKG
jgi:ribonucleoside-diphosphate reductase beta chain